MSLNQNLNGLNPLSYLGVNALAPMNLNVRSMDPASSDTKNVAIGDMWINTTNNRMYQIINLSGGIAVWEGVGYFITRTVDPTSDDYLYALGTMWLNTGTLDVFQLLQVSNMSATWVLMMDSSGPLLQLTTDDSTVVSPAAGNINLHGTNNITTTGAGSTATVSLTGTTNHALQLGNASGGLTSLAVATNGQIPIGSTGSNPVLAVLTASTNIAITNGMGSINIATSQAQLLTNYTLVNTTPYTVLATDYYLGVDCSGSAITVKLPNAPTANRMFVIKDITGNAGTNNITVTTVGGSVTLDGSTSFVMNTNYQSATLAFISPSYQIY